MDQGLPAHCCISVADSWEPAVQSATRHMRARTWQACKRPNQPAWSWLLTKCLGLIVQGAGSVLSLLSTVQPRSGRAAMLRDSATSEMSGVQLDQPVAGVTSREGAKSFATGSWPQPAKQTCAAGMSLSLLLTAHCPFISQLLNVASCKFDRAAQFWKCQWFVGHCLPLMLALTHMRRVSCAKTVSLTARTAVCRVGQHVETERGICRPVLGRRRKAHQAWARRLRLSLPGTLAKPHLPLHQSPCCWLRSVIACAHDC